MVRPLKVWFKSRGLFKNWFTLGIRYWLIKHGLLKNKNLHVICKDSKDIIIDTYTYSKLLNGYYYGAIKSFYCDNGPAIAVSWHKREVKFPLGVIPYIRDILYENILGDAYGDLDVEGRTVVDVGAGVGDTAAMFALKGAQKVIAIEPYPSLYKIAKSVVELNNLGNRIMLLNAGLGRDDKQVSVGNCEVGYEKFSPEKCIGDIKVRIYTLETLVKEFGIRNAILKMDCEGCEYEILLNTDVDTLRTFKQIQVEYHNGYDPLKMRLEEAGFKVEIKRMKSVEVPVERQGYLVARTDL